MPQSLVQHLIHLTYSTKDRRRLLDSTYRQNMHGMMATVFDRMDSPVLKIGGTDDHVHVLFSLSKNRSLAEVVRTVKSSTAKWANDEGHANGLFSWQSGYGAFSVSHSVAGKVKHYIETQEEHHKKLSFREEFEALLEKHGIEYDEQRLWG